MSKEYDRLLHCADCVRGLTDFTPETAIVLGSGLGDFAQSVDSRAEIGYGSIEGFPVSTVAGHAGRFVFGYIGEKPIVIMQGRVHYYEGYSMEDVVLPIRLMGLLGARTLLLTNASGGIDADFSVGDLMLITGQIASLVPSPLRGENDERLGPRFPDMSEIYTPRLCGVLRGAARRLGITLREGTYIQTPGPNYESPEEIKMYRALGAHAVGMSTACEAIAARHMGMEICGISCISNMAAGMLKKKLSHEDIQEMSLLSGGKLGSLIRAAVPEM